jgi:hypothetical protein
MECNQYMKSKETGIYTCAEVGKQLFLFGAETNLGNAQGIWLEFDSLTIFCFHSGFGVTNLRITHAIR